METATQNIYQLRVALREISPLVWRRVLISGNATLADLHDVLQTVFDWDDSRLHSFRIHGKEYGSESGDPRKVVLGDLQLVSGERFLYEYNFCAGWQCDVRLEKLSPPDPKHCYPICTGGRWPSPPEDCSDPPEYLERLEQHRLGPSFEELTDLHSLGEAFPTPSGYERRVWRRSSSNGLLSPLFVPGLGSRRSCVPQSSAGPNRMVPRPAGQPDRGRLAWQTSRFLKT